MAEIALHFEFAKDANLDEASHKLQSELSKLDGVSEVDAVPEKPRLTGLEIVAAIAVTISIVKGTRELIVEVRKLIPEVKGLIRDIRGLKDVTVEVGTERVPLDKLTDAQIEQLAKEAG